MRPEAGLNQVRRNDESGSHVTAALQLHKHAVHDPFLSAPRLFLHRPRVMGNQQAQGSGSASGAPSSPLGSASGSAAASNVAAASAAASATAAGSAPLPKGVKRLPPELQQKFASGSMHNSCAFFHIRGLFARLFSLPFCRHAHANCV